MTAHRYVDALLRAEPPTGPSGAVCCYCQRWTYAPVEVRHIERPSGPGFTLFACPDDAVKLQHGLIPKGADQEA